jgi:hypothetical protein
MEQKQHSPLMLPEMLFDSLDTPGVAADVVSLQFSTFPERLLLLLVL